MRGFGKSEFPPLILKGIATASRDYLKSNDGWLWRAPEYWVTTYIAKELMRGIDEAKRVVSLETSVSRALTAAGAKQRGPKKAALHANGRFDIVVGQGNKKPRAVIEVKSPVSDSKPTANIYKDFGRLVSTLSHGRARSNINSAIFAFYSDIAAPRRGDKTAKKKIERKFGGDGCEFHEHVQSYATKHGVQASYHVSKAQDEGEYGARIWGCVVFSRLPKS